MLQNELTDWCTGRVGVFDETIVLIFVWIQAKWRARDDNAIGGTGCFMMREVNE